MLSRSLDAFIDAGYVIRRHGSFALPTDALAIAKQGRLHRNFQGYSTQPDCDLIGWAVGDWTHRATVPAKTPRPWMSITISFDQVACQSFGAGIEPG